MIIADRIASSPGIPASEAILQTWLIYELLADTGGRRYRRWLDAGRPPFPDTGIVYVGDEGIRRAVVDVVGRLPPPVAWHVARNVLFVGVGLSSRGWLTSLPSMDKPDEPTHQVIAITPCPDDLPTLIAHEIAHAWLVPTVRDQLMELANEWGNSRARLENGRRKEAQAAALAYAWGFRGPGANVRHCVGLVRFSAPEPQAGQRGVRESLREKIRRFSDRAFSRLLKPHMQRSGTCPGPGGIGSSGYSAHTGRRAATANRFIRGSSRQQQEPGQ